MLSREITIALEREFSLDLAEGIRSLIPQLSSSAELPTDQNIREMLACPSTYFFSAFCEGKLVGMTTLAIFRIPTGLRGIIEDVVVDETQRGKGIARKLVTACIKLSTEMNLRTIDLTSSPKRIDANAMYPRVGFSQRTTNNFRYDVPKSKSGVLGSN